MGTLGGILIEPVGGHQAERLSWGQFRATRGTIQGGVVLPTLFNVVVYSVVFNWLSLMVEDNTVIKDVLGHAVSRSLGGFYTDCEFMGSQDLEWLQR